MKEYGQNPLGFLLVDDCYEVVSVLALDSDITECDALNQIIQEWSESKRIEPFSLRSNDLGEKELKEILEGIDNRLTLIEGFLCDAQVTVVKREQVDDSEQNQ